MAAVTQPIAVLSWLQQVAGNGANDDHVHELSGRGNKPWIEYDYAQEVSSEKEEKGHK